MKRILGHLKTYVLRGFWALIPLALSVIAIRFLYLSIDQRVMGYISRYLGIGFPGLGILLLVLTLYLVGLIASNFLGRQVLGWVERISARIPMIKTTYRVGQQLAATFTVAEKRVFRKALLVQFLTPGMWTIGFVTGSLVDPGEPGQRLLKIYIPTPPNPASGTIVIVPESQTRDPGWSIEDAMKAVISAGILGPDEMR